MFLLIIFMFFKLISPASFLTADPVLIIKDSHNEPFLVGNLLSKFNLPAGEYNTKNKIQKYGKFTPYPAIAQEGVPVTKTGLQIRAGVSDAGKALGFDPKNKASFFPDFNTAFFCEDILNHWFFPCKIFTVCHEEGHHYFKPDKMAMATLENLFADPKERETAYHNYLEAEHQCDVYGYNKMVRNGYNPIQVKQAISKLLKPGNDRINMLIQKINVANREA